MGDGAVAEKLLAELDARLGTALAYAEPPEALSGGFSNQIFTFRLADPPPGFEGVQVLRLAHNEDDVAREVVLQDGVANAGYPAPRVLLRGSSEAFGQPYVVTPFVAGTDYETLLRPTTAIGVIRRMPVQLADAMAELHAVPIDAMVEPLADAGWTKPRLGSIGALDEVAELAGELHDAGLDRAVEWLRAHAPEFGAPVVCHGDLHPLNMLYEGDRVTAVLDWELARIADPMFDVARTIILVGMAPYPMSRAARRIVHPIARRLARSFVSRYGSHRAVSETSLEWHEALHALRTLVIVRAGTLRPDGDRLRRTADVWAPLSGDLSSRFRALSGVDLG